MIKNKKALEVIGDTIDAILTIVFGVEHNLIYIFALTSQALRFPWSVAGLTAGKATLTLISSRDDVVGNIYDGVNAYVAGLYTLAFLEEHIAFTLYTVIIMYISAVLTR